MKKHSMTANRIHRRDFLRLSGAGLFVAGVHWALPLLPAWALSQSRDIKRIGPQRRYDLTMAYTPLEIDGRRGTATAINGTVPGPLIHLREGDDVELNVTNRMMDVPHSSIHWQCIEGQVAITVLEGQGQFLGDGGKELDAHVGDVLISDINEPHGIRAVSDLRVLVTIAPPN